MSEVANAILVDAMRNRTTAELVLERLQREVVTGQLKPGQRLVERELTERYRVSRTPLREALKRLVASGLATNVPYRGVAIRQLSHGFARDIYDLRVGIEGLGAYLAALRATQDDLDSLQHLFDRIDEASARDERDEVLVLNLEFHRAIARATRNALLVEKVEELWVNINLVRASAWQGTMRTQGSRREHELILRAILARDPEGARHATESHVRSSWQLVEAFLVAQAESGKQEPALATGMPA